MRLSFLKKNKLGFSIIFSLKSCKFTKCSILNLFDDDVSYNKLKIYYFFNLQHQKEYIKNDTYTKLFKFYIFSIIIIVIIFIANIHIF